jgi:hypothetical protein
MTDRHRLELLHIALVTVGAIAIAGLYPLMKLWPSGWAWHSGHSDYPAMIVGIYATLGVFLILAARNPLEHLSLIWFTVLSSIVHGGIMAVQSVASPGQHGHLIGDVPVLFLVAIVLAVLTPRGARARAMQRAARDQAASVGGMVQVSASASASQARNAGLESKAST